MTDYKPPYRAGALAGGLVFLLYAITLAPTTAWWDTSEYIATAYILGIPHPPGNPLFVALAKTWSLLLAPLGLSVAVRINLFAALTSALASFFFFLVIHRILSVTMKERWMATVGAAAGALIGATAYTVWNQSNVNEKVYTVSVMVIAAVSWLVLRWYDRRDQPAGLRPLLAAIYLMVLGSTSHLMSVLAVPAVGIVVLLAAPSVLWSGRFWARLVPLILIGLSFSFFLPIRAAQRPVINEGDPVCDSFVESAKAIYTNGKQGCEALGSSLTREQYGKADWLTERQAPIGHQMLNYFQWFDWQWARGLDLSEQPLGARLPATVLFLALGIMGFMVMWRSDRTVFVYFTTLALTLTVGLVVYLNFKYGYSLAPYIQDFRAHEVRERDYFFTAGFMLWGVIAGIGLAGFWAALSEQIGGNYMKASPVFLVALVPLVFNWSWADRSGDYAARDWAYDLLMSVEPYGVLFTNGDNDTFPLWYAQEVEDVRKDVTVIVVQYLYTEWYTAQLRDLTEPSRQRLFDEQFAFGIYDPVTPKPSGAITTLSNEEMRGAVGAVLDRDVTIRLGPLAVQYPEGTYLDRAHQLALRIIADSLEERPIYFASTGGLLGDLGLRNWGVRHGLATKLLMRDLDDEELPEGLVKVTPEMGGEVFDLERNLALVNDVYEYRGLLDRAIWQDRSTLNIPVQYQFLFGQLADAVRMDGRPEEEFNAMVEMAAAFRVTALGGTKYLAD
jgi:MFS family permease